MKAYRPRAIRAKTRDGKVCPKHGTTLRYACSNDCIQCVKERSAASVRRRRALPPDEPVAFGLHAYMRAWR